MLDRLYLNMAQAEALLQVVELRDSLETALKVLATSVEGRKEVYFSHAQDLLDQGVHGQTT